MSEFIAIYSFLLNGSMTIAKEKITDFLEDLKTNITTNILNINDVLIDLICYAITICETKAQLKIICNLFNIIKTNNQTFFEDNIEQFAFLLSQNTKVFKTLKNITSSQSYINEDIYNKIIEKYIKNELDNLVEITPANKESIIYYDNIIDNLNIKDTELLQEYKTQIETYKEIVEIQEVSEETILNEILNMKQEKAVS